MPSRSSRVEAWLTVASAMIGDVVREQRRRHDRPVVNLRPRERELHRRIHTGAPDGQHHIGARLTAQRRDCLLGGVVLRGDPVDGGDLVAGLDAGPLGRCVGQRRDHGDPPGANLDLDAESAVVARRGLGEGLVIVALEQVGIGVVQLVQHADRGLLVERRFADAVHVVRLHPGEHIIEQARALVHAAVVAHTALQQPAPGKERDARHCQDKSPPLLHDCLQRSGRRSRTAVQAASSSCSGLPVASKCTMPGPVTAT